MGRGKTTVPALHRRPGSQRLPLPTVECQWTPGHLGGDRTGEKGHQSQAEASVEEDCGFHGPQIHVRTSLYSTRNMNIYISIPLGKILYRLSGSRGSGFQLPSFSLGRRCTHLSLYVSITYAHTHIHTCIYVFFFNRMKLASWSSSKM